MSNRRVDQPRGRRRIDHLRIAPGENWYRDVVLFFVTVFVVIAVSTSHSAVQQQNKDRAGTAKTICGALNAVILAGRATITGQTNVSLKFEKSLQKLGFPPKAVRQKQAREAARQYGEAVVREVKRTTKGKGGYLVHKDGTLACDKLPTVVKQG